MIQSRIQHPAATYCVSSVLHRTPSNEVTITSTFDSKFMIILSRRISILDINNNRNKKKDKEIIKTKILKDR